MRRPSCADRKWFWKASATAALVAVGLTGGGDVSGWTLANDRIAERVSQEVRRIEGAAFVAQLAEVNDPSELRTKCEANVKQVADGYLKCTLPDVGSAARSHKRRRPLGDGRIQRQPIPQTTALRSPTALCGHRLGAHCRRGVISWSMLAPHPQPSSSRPAPSEVLAPPHLALPVMPRPAIVGAIDDAMKACEAWKSDDATPSLRIVTPRRAGLCDALTGQRTTVKAGSAAVSLDLPASWSASCSRVSMGRGSSD